MNNELGIMRKILIFIFKKISKLIIWRFQPDVIAITGSVGKTSAKEAIFAVLKDKRRIRKSISGLNTEIGLPLSIIGDEKDFPEEKLRLVAPNSFFSVKSDKKILKLFFWAKALFLGLSRLILTAKASYPEILILEYAVGHPGDMSALLEIAKPKIGVITAIGDIPPHIEFFTGPEAIAKEKTKLIEDLSVNDFVVLNFDNEKTIALNEKTRAKIMTFGFKEGADLRISGLEKKLGIDKPFGISFKFEYDGSFVPVYLNGIIGVSHVYAAAAGVAVGLIYGLNLVEAAESFSSNYKAVKGRMNLISGKKNIYIINDSYNASFLSVKLALETLEDVKNLRKVVILGDMLELGDFSEEAHQAIGKKITASIADILITVGPLAKIISDEAKKSGLNEEKIFIFNSADEALKSIDGIIQANDIVLIKASRAMGLDKIVDYLSRDL